MRAQSDTTLHLHDDSPLVHGHAVVYAVNGERRVKASLSGGGQSIAAIGTDPLAMLIAVMRQAQHIVEHTPDAELHADEHDRDVARRLAMKVLAGLTDDATAVRDGMGDLLAAVQGERWPTVAEVAGEVHGGVSCGYSGCTPADPCGACQTLAGTQGGERP